ncbi:ABC transporter ATP-binding protein [Nanchangia anserum]|uniref:ABC transporter ATP-binding protein n=1 Tax=Nanchangia anserum TaxID=2692125 RepID=UPI0018835995|nr:ABC transporter ATP-binding protein [Nanchangia anserum]QOX81890.1 ABC transporter ATP-binding protein [Nanchangia anserum]
MDLDISPGEIVALLGPNGAGKTTLIDIILGLQSPDRGERMLCGLSPRDAIARGLVGALHQHGALLTDLRVGSLVRFVADTMETHRDLDELMVATGIEALARRRVGKCSGGEQQRIRLALALLSDPLFLFLDEPTVGMDVASRTAFWQIMDDEAQRGRTIVFATHYLTEAQQYAQRTIIMRSGRVIADGSTAQLAADYADSTLTLRCDATDTVARDALESASAGRPWHITVEGGMVTVRGNDLDDAARAGLALPGARDLSLTHSTIEDAYLALTTQTTL